MINMVPYNYFKPNEYKYYHIHIFNDNKPISYSFDNSLDDIKKLVDGIDNKNDFIVIGTTDNIESIINFISKNILIILNKEDIFNYKHDFLVNCTEYFKNIKFNL